MGRGKEIRIYLASGTVTGIRTAELINWTGIGLLFPRTHIGEIKEWPEATGCSVYFLFGKDEESGEPAAYIGQTDDMGTRIKKHATEKEFWNEVVFFTSKDSNFNAAHVKYLEARLCILATEAGRFHLANKAQPKIPELSRAEIDNMEKFLDNTRILIGAFGYKVIEPLISKKKHTADVIDDDSLEDDADIFFFEGKSKGKKWKARAAKTEEGMVLLSGSLLSNKGEESLKQGNVDHRRFIRFYIDEADNSWFLKHNILCSSPSQAAAVVCGAERNGWEVWKNSIGETLRQHEDKMLSREKQRRAALEEIKNIRIPPSILGRFEKK